MDRQDSELSFDIRVWHVCSTRSWPKLAVNKTNNFLELGIFDMWSRIFAFRQNQKNPYFVHTKSMQPWPIGLIFRHLCCLPNPPTNTKPPSTDLAQHPYKRSREFSARRHHHRPSYHYRHQWHETKPRRRPLVMAGAFVWPLWSNLTASSTTMRRYIITFGTVRLRFKVPHGLPGYVWRVETMMASLRCRWWMVRRQKCNNQPKTQRNNNSMD